MKMVSWNIQQGGGSRVDRIVDQLHVWNADVVGLSEFRGSDSSNRIAESLEKMGLVYQESPASTDDRNRNGLLLASRHAMVAQPSTGALQQTGRWLHVTIGSTDFALMHVPNRDESEYHGIQDVKYVMQDAVVESFERLKDGNAVAFGDTNSGRIGSDETSAYFNKQEDEWFQRIETVGWTDAWRSRNPNEREYTWYTGRANESGFRLDQLFATKSIEPRITSIKHDWGEGGRDAKLSDHTAIVCEIDC
jgi:exonuclease III